MVVEAFWRGKIRRLKAGPDGGEAVNAAVFCWWPMKP